MRSQTMHVSGGRLFQKDKIKNTKTLKQEADGGVVIWQHGQDI